MARTLREQYKQARSSGNAELATSIRSKMNANRSAGIHDAIGSGMRAVQFAVTGQTAKANRAARFFRENLRVIRTGSPARSTRAASDASRI